MSVFILTKILSLTDDYEKDWDAINELFSLERLTKFLTFTNMFSFMFFLSVSKNVLLKENVQIVLMFHSVMNILT